MSVSREKIGAVVENVAGSRFEMAFAGGLAFASFRRDGDRLIVTHTEVPAAFNGQGLGSQLVRGVFETARASDRRIVAGCSFVADWARRHPEFADVLA
ncbi:GNAT family N-acetyltransferase [Bosea sp. (in: a-proteobacteria)]|uniref:GNAT family N-acetyltransferase n=1 Tax=Bosea sp. (in: a-proteobacteria) TaxID=1871050 RepID=UPI002734E7CA|nr:GNAT family N-acetyltransferase [Bosea sp. (in: a-proteobacteria)]MDP3411377.1 GNAT family N-acetyltransferase [Bosea sp. (in: a-proteobacteria)]